MSANSSIEWTDATWNPTLGCMKVSAGCESCYAIRTAYRQEHAFKRAEYQGLTRKLPDGSINWTGQINAIDARLMQPLGWKEPRRIFVNSQSDLFHKDMSLAFLREVWLTMAQTRRHTYQVLTKRPAIMHQVLSDAEFVDELAERYEAIRSYPLSGLPAWTWPLPNVWLGVSVEHQQAADERIPLLLQTPAAVRFLSCEPLLGPLRLENVRCGCDGASSIVCTRCNGRGLLDTLRSGISWVIAGGESGPKHRPLDPDWARSLRDQCEASGVAYFFKQWGGRTPKAGGRLLDGREWSEFPRPAVPA